ncbi:hypothetical protein [Bacillus paranthracis]|uniref:hypothetical protein n=1 Tax=Bacillus paranthracis TaxID=2026186 RepID=UPI0034DE0366
MTNIPSKYVAKEAIHELYSLRWQIEIDFSYSSQFKYKKGVLRVSYLRKINCALIIFHSDVPDATIITGKKTKKFE